MCQFADFKQVICHPAHDFAGFMGIIKTVGQRLQMGKHVCPHLCLHVYAHHMTFILDKVIQQHFDEIQAQQGQSENHDHPVIPVRNQCVQHGAGNHGIDNPDH